MNHMTAKVSCFARAYHHADSHYPVFDDTAAAALLGSEFDLIAQNMTAGIPFFLPDFKGTSEEGLRLIVARQLAPSVLGRSAYCEHMLQQEMQKGCRQYLIFAAGYDTFAIRNTDRSLSVFELDIPELLDDKQSRIKNAGLETSAVAVPCDLAQITWKEALIKRGYSPAQVSFSSLLGISYYLSKAEWKALLSAVSSIIPKKSSICFDYPSSDESTETKTNKALAQAAHEEMKALYSYEEISTLLAQCGFMVCEHLQHDTMTDRFFSQYNRRTPEHPMQAPRGVDYIFAVKEH